MWHKDLLKLLFRLLSTIILKKKFEALLGNGLNPILDKDVSMITIAGMGAFLIGDILEENKDYIDQNKRLFLQPNANSDHLREYLFKNNFTILDEKNDSRWTSYL